MKRLVTALLAPAIVLAACGARADPTASDDEALHGFALARCLGAAFPTIRNEADAAAGGYLERGSAAFEAYEEIEALAAEFAQRDYPGKSGEDLSIMKCFDLLNSAELAAIIERHAGGRR